MLHLIPLCLVAWWLGMWLNVQISFKPLLESWPGFWFDCVAKKDQLQPQCEAFLEKERKCAATLWKAPYSVYPQFLLSKATFYLYKISDPLAPFATRVVHWKYLWKELPILVFCAGVHDSQSSARRGVRKWLEAGSRHGMCGKPSLSVCSTLRRRWRIKQQWRCDICSLWSCDTQHFVAIRLQRRPGKIQDIAGGMIWISVEMFGPRCHCFSFYTVMICAI